MAPQAVHHAQYVNVVVITGTVLQTPELRSTAAGRAVTTADAPVHADAAAVIAMQYEQQS